MLSDSVLVVVINSIVLKLPSSTSVIEAFGCLSGTAAVLCRAWTSYSYLDSNEDVNTTAVVVSCASLVIFTILLDVQPDFFLHHICRGSIHGPRLRLLSTVYYCAFSIVLKI